MNEIARWTTPAITYAPSAVELTDIDEIYLVVSQNGCEVIRKPIEEATVQDGRFMWFFSQQETSRLNSRAKTYVKIDYKVGEMRYTTRWFVYDTSESAINEVI